ncbi:hypothetical protein [Vibrio spartinae]|uniref:hypothetical protein n=1 Tax=Vibrio spartinae TaxID=1918945 RepID=UPI0011150C84|nr:hypothetical protein [Vibrio spartinae]
MSCLFPYFFPITGCVRETIEEIVFVYEAKFKDEDLYNKTEMVGVETNGERFVVKWFDEEEIKTNNIPFYPDGIVGLLSND